MQRHRHRCDPRKSRLLTHRRGIPYETERTVCSICGEVIEERLIRRAEA